MKICSVEFLIACGMVALVFHLLLPGKRLRQCFLGILNLAFLVSFLPNLRSGLCFILFFLGSYGLLRLARARPSWRVILLSLATIVPAFLIIKRYTFIQWLVPEALWNHQVVLIGLSYMLFKFIHVLIDQWQGQLAPITLASYLNYQLAFFTLLAGPIQRYNEFRRYFEDMDLGQGDAKQTLLAWNRVLTGIIKMGFIATLASLVFERAGAYWGTQSTSEFLLRFGVFFYSYPLYLYFNFSGYTDIAIGSARLLGFVLPENFNQPFLARNVIDYWNRWHITLSHWIRDYVFMTSYKAVAERFPSCSKIFGYIMLFLSLLLAGAWHGSTLNFVVFGALNGLGAAVNQIYADGLKRILGRSGFQNYQKNAYVRWTAIGLTFHFTCFAMLFFSSSTQLAWEILHALGSRIF